MAFWGVHLEPEKSFTHRFDKRRGRLHISQATLGFGCSTEMSGVQCTVGDNGPILLCAFLPSKNVSCPLNLEFEEEEDDVIFTVRGRRSVYLSGFYTGIGGSENVVIENKKVDEGRGTWVESKMDVKSQRVDATVQIAEAEKDIADADHISNEDQRQLIKKRKTSDEKVSTVKTEDKIVKVIPLQERSFTNGMVIADLEYGNRDSEGAAPGSNVTINYTGTLNGEVFDSCLDGSFKFRLGVGEVIKGFDVGINGMRIGDKRRLTIPPSMNTGARKGLVVPRKSWLIYDIELVDVQ